MGPPFPPGGFPGHGFGPGGPGFGPGFGFGPGGRGMSGGRGRGVRGEGRGHGRGRARRGNVRAAVLTLLAERSMHGYEMIQEITQRSGGIWRPSPGSVYPTLQLLADEGMVTIEEGASGKRQYALTEAGQAEAAKHAQTPPWEQMAFDVDPTEIDLRSAFGQLATAAFQVSQAASSEQKSRATKALIEARQQMYLILAEAGVDPSDAEPSDTEPDLDDDSDDE
jgi:DNA-binding PadR family transcriptional regulator